MDYIPNDAIPIRSYTYVSSSRVYISRHFAVVAAGALAPDSHCDCIQDEPHCSQTPLVFQSNPLSYIDHRALLWWAGQLLQPIRWDRPRSALYIML